MTRSIRKTALLAVVALGLGSTCVQKQAAFAQRAVRDNAPRERTADEQELDDMRSAAGRQILLNFIAQGVNPGEFFAEVFSGMPDGGFDGEFFRAKLLEKNLIDEKTLGRIDETTQRVADAKLQEELDVSDAGLERLRAKVQRVLDAGYAADVQLPKGPVLGLRPSAEAKAEVQRLLKAVEAISKDADAKPREIHEKVVTWRDAKQHAMADYVEAQQRLIEVCTERQQGFFMSIGLVD